MLDKARKVKSEFSKCQIPTLFFVLFFLKQSEIPYINLTGSSRSRLLETIQHMVVLSQHTEINAAAK